MRRAYLHRLRPADRTIFLTKKFEAADRDDAARTLALMIAVCGPQITPFMPGIEAAMAARLPADEREMLP